MATPIVTPATNSAFVSLSSWPRQIRLQIAAAMAKRAATKASGPLAVTALCTTRKVPPQIKVMAIRASSGRLIKVLDLGLVTGDTGFFIESYAVGKMFPIILGGNILPACVETRGGQCSIRLAILLPRWLPFRMAAALRPVNAGVA